MRSTAMPRRFEPISKLEVPPSICKLSDIKLNGGQVVYTTLCTGAKENVITTTYHGDSFESADSP